MKVTNQIFSPETVSLITEFVNQKYSYKKMSRLLDIRIKFLKEKIKELFPDYKPARINSYESVLPEILELVEKGYTPGAIGDVLDLSSTGIKAFLEKNGIPFKLEKNEWINEIHNPELINLFEKGHNLRLISRIMKRRTGFIRDRMNDLNLWTEQRIKATKNSELKPSGVKICWTCGVTKDLKLDFYKNSSRCCKGCARKRSVKQNQDYREVPNLSKLLNKKMGEAKGRLNRDFDLTLEFLLKLFHDQNGKCFYSGIPLADFTGSPRTVSIDRIDSSKGYTQDNVALSCKHMNLLKNDLDIESLLDLAQKITDNAENIRSKIDSN